MTDQEMMDELLKIIHIVLPETETESVTPDGSGCDRRDPQSAGRRCKCLSLIHGR